VFGVVLFSSGEPAADATVTLRSDVVLLGASAQIGGPPPLMITGHTASDGTFMLPNVPPGSYTLQALAQRFGPGAIFRGRRNPGARAGHPNGSGQRRCPADAGNGLLAAGRDRR
jgi:hypothetical protein